MPLDLTDDMSILAQIMAWCRQATRFDGICISKMESEGLSIQVHYKIVKCFTQLLIMDRSSGDDDPVFLQLFIKFNGLAEKKGC